ncbi:unnamed protein product [Clonostachys rosea f. rosea IK726]|uniref:Uncharacterized protein n=1 Tax=Clonostachys rosea f. rosea IK726 TaxID=1349383 RepID=A0ACA9U8B1_BIOOC|nr:unnamed protein product [Clonostachys rosea f. rosea IK726]
MSDSEDPIDPIDEGGDDLFGDDDDGDVIESPKERVLDDDDLASDPEGETYNRYREDDDTRQQDEVTRETMIADVTAYRHPIPKPSDGILRALRVPKFLKFLPEEYHPEAFQASELDIENARSEQQQHVVRFRRDDSTGRLHSNTNILRWDDGSVTISVGGEQYEVIKKPLAPAADKPYDEVKDVHYYAAAAELSSNMLITVGHVTEQYTVRPSKEIGDDALNLLADRMAQATKSQNRDMIIRTTVDPELQKKKAELLEKERMKAQRKRENAQAKQETGYGRSGRGGLSIGALEGGHEELLRGAGRQEKYEDDGFVVDSDEEEEEEEASEDDDDLLDDADEAPRKKRQKAREPEEDEDASGDDVDPIAEASARSRRRNVIDDDDDEEE